MSFEVWLLYFTTVFVASIIPGPSMMLALTHGMQFGVRKAAVSSFGVIISTMIQAGISIAGLGAILLASEFLFIVVKISGAIYLAYLGIMILVKAGSVYLDYKTVYMKPTFKKLLSQGIMVSLFNPKAVIFFTAFFPQFINKANAGFQSYFLLLFTLAAVHFGCSMIYAFAGKKVVLFFRNSGVLISRLLGFLFLVTGLTMIFTTLHGHFTAPEKG